MTFWNRTPADKTDPKSDNHSVVADKLNVHDSAQALITKQRSLSDKVGISAAWTVTKNKGRANEQVACDRKKNLITDGGIDFILERLYESATTVVVAEVIDRLALSSNQTAPTAADTTFPGEIILTDLRRTGTIAAELTVVDLPAATDTVDITYEYTATQAHSNIHKAALFQSAIATIPIHVIAFATDVDLVSGDTLTVEIEITYDIS